MIDWGNAIIAEERREDFFQNPPVGQHVGDATGDAEIVFEHGKAAIGKADQIGATDADVDSARDVEAAHLAPEVAAGVDEFLGDDPVGEDFSGVVNVFEKQIQRGNALRQATLDLAPFAIRDDAGKKVVGENAFGAFGTTINGECYSLMKEG